MKEIAPNVFVNTSSSLVTVGAIRSGDGWVCIDAPPYPADADAWLAALKAVDDRPVRFLINTDYHRDRIIGNQQFGAPVVAHEYAARRVLELGDNYISQTADSLNGSEHDLMALANLELAPPQLSFSSIMTLYAGDLSIELVSKPSATAGSLWVVLDDAKVIFAGDTVVTRQHPYIDSCASKNWLEVLRSIRHERYSDWTIVSGREGVIDPADTEQLSEYLRVARRRVTSVIRAEGPRSEVSRAVPEMQEYFPIKGGKDRVQYRIKAGLEAIYDEMSTLSENDEDEEES
jgi:glyoxylase-like metal-dependent hydrolase (beta-lactamase superfamily II)